ncbi:MAG: DUF4270 family protein [Flavobacteriales bacterium]
MKLKRKHPSQFGRPTSWAALLLGTLVLLQGCQKPEDDLGLDLIPADAQLGLFETDTISVLARTVTDEPVRTSALSRNVLGSYVDRQFGLLQAGIAVQVRLTSNSVGQGQNTTALVADSVVLSLVYDGLSPVYGNLTPQEFHVHELGEDLSASADTTYKSDRIPVTLQGDLMREKGVPITPRPFEGPHIGGDSLPAQLRLRLEDVFAQRLMSAWGTSDLENNTNFLLFLKGLVLSVSPQTVPGKGGLLNFPLEAGNSKLTLYYHDTTVGAEDTLAYDFAINSNSARYTFVNRDFQQATDPGLLNVLADSTRGQKLDYLQTFGGARVVLDLPHIQDFANEGLDVVAKAELIMPIAGDYVVENPPPSIIFAFRKNDEGEDTALPDQTSGIGQIGGLYDATAQEYRFNLTRYVQGLIQGDYPNTGLQIVPGFNGVSGNRAVFGGPEHPVTPTRLRLTFTTY